MPVVLPVICHYDMVTSLQQASIIFDCGADGVILMSSDSNERLTLLAAEAVKLEYPDKRIGVNLCHMDERAAVRLVKGAYIDILWVHVANEILTSSSEQALSLQRALIDVPHLDCFTSLLGNHAEPAPILGQLAIYATRLGLIPVTQSISNTPPLTPEQILDIRLTLNTEGRALPLAVSAGITMGNVATLAPLASHFFLHDPALCDRHHVHPDVFRPLILSLKGATPRGDITMEPIDIA